MMAGGGPRRPHPPPSQPAVARVTPMVPEVSLFFPSQPKPGNGKSPHLWMQGDPRGRVPLGDFSRTNPPINESNPRPDPSKPSQRAFNHPSNPTRRALNNPSNLGPTTFHNSSNPAPRAFNNFNQSRKPLNLPSNPSPTPSAVNSPAPAPAPHRAPTPTQFKPQSDFSRMFAGVDMTCLVPGEQGAGGRQQEGVSGKGGFMVANGGADDTQMFNVLEKMVGQGSEDRSQEDGGRWINSSGELERGDSRNGWRERNERQRSCNEPQKQNIGNNDNVNIAPKSQYDLHQKQDYPRQEIVYPYQSQNEKQETLDNQVGNFNNVRNGSKNVQFTPIDRNDVNQNLQFTPNPNGTDDGSNARMPPQNWSNPNDTGTQSSMGTQSTPDLKSPPHTNLASHSQPNLVSQASPLPPDLIQVLSWQNDQLRQLQKQVEILLQSPARRLETPSTTPTQTPAATCTASTMTSMVWPDLEAAMAKLAAATDTPEHPTAATDTPEHPTAATDTPEHPTVEEMNNSSVSTSPQPSLHLDLPDYTPSEVSPQTGGGRRGKAMVDIKDIDSPVLGESVSMYESSGEADNPQELYNNILGQVRRMLDVDGDPLSPITEQSTTTTESSTQQSSTQPSRSQPRLPAPQPPPTTPVLPSRPTPPSPAVDPATATLERLRSLGISFISPADLTPATVQSAQDTGNKYNSVYLPTAAEPSISVFQGASPDTSLDINSLALKYLDDSQLTRLAEKHLGAENEEQIPVNKNRPEKEESGNNFSMATHQFLNRYGLGEQTSSDKYNGLPSKTAKSRRNGYLDVIQETHPSHVTRDRQLVNHASVPQNQINHMQISPQNNLLQQSPHPPQHLSRQPQQQHSPRLQQVQPHQFQQQSPLLQREPQTQRFQHEHVHRFQHQQSPNFHQSPPLLRQQTPPLLPQQVLQLQQGGYQQHSPRLRQQIPVNLQAGSNVNIPNRILDITAIRQQPKLL